MFHALSVQSTATLLRDRPVATRSDQEEYEEAATSITRCAVAVIVPYHMSREKYSHPPRLSNHRPPFEE